MPEIPIIDAKMKRMSPQVIVRVKITSEFKIRAWIAKQLLGLAVWVLGAQIKFMEDELDGPQKPT